VPPPDPLGPRNQHDPRSVRYAVPVWPRSAIKSADWTRRAPALDQGSLGSCTGNAAVGLLATDCATRPGLTSVVVDGEVLPVDEELALKVYSLATQLDEFQGTWPPEDTGSSGLGAAKALQRLGLCDSYQHAFGIAALDTALQSGPVMVGTYWYGSMFEPGPDGLLTLDYGSGIAGGHEYVISALVAESGLYRLDNSWGSGWGIGGSAFLRRDDLAALLAMDGDVTQPVFPAPPAPVPDTSADAELWADVQRWARAKGLA
jgi:hypothetical protein